MKHLIAIVSLAFAALLADPAPASADCRPAGYCPFIGCQGWYNWIADGGFQQGGTCWSTSGNVAIRNDGQMCVPTGYAQFGLAYPSASLSQVVHVAGRGEPGYDPGLDPSRFMLDYRLQLVDPQHDGFGVVVTLALYDARTGALLQWIATHTGAQGDRACPVTYVEFRNANLAGKDVRVEVRARNIYTNTTVRVSNLALWQLPRPL